jgi:hypothetical protein
MILNDKPNCQVSRILVNPRPILSDSSENDPILISNKNRRQVFLTVGTNLSCFGKSAELRQEASADRRWSFFSVLHKLP